jgi:hypothetical protein
MMEKVAGIGQALGGATITTARQTLRLRLMALNSGFEWALASCVNRGKEVNLIYNYLF